MGDNKLNINEGIELLSDLINDTIPIVTDFEEEPVSLQVFLYDKAYLGLPPLSPIQFDFVEACSEIYPPCKYTEAVAEWGKGSGKDFVCMISMARVVYLLECLHDPAVFYGFPPRTFIDCLNVAVNSYQANNVFFEPFRQMITTAPIFKKIGYDDKTGYIKFPKNVRAISGHSDMEGLEGYNLILAILDEIDAFKTEEEVRTLSRRAKHAKAIYDRMTSTTQSRFPGIAKVACISFPRFRGSFIQRRREKGLTEPRTFVSAPEGVPTWVANPLRKREDFDDEFIKDPERASAMYECMIDAPIVLNNKRIMISEVNTEDVVHKYIRHYKGNGIIVHPTYLQKRIFTSEHPVLVRESNWQKDHSFSRLSELKWKNAKDLTTKDFLVIRKPKFDYEECPLIPTKELMRLCGLFVSEKFTCHARETEMMNEVVDCFKKVFGIDTVYHISNSEGFLRENKKQQGEAFSFFNKNFGSRASNAKLPNWLFSLDEELRREFLKYIYLGDGNKKFNKWTYNSISDDLRFGIWLLVQSLGGFASWQDYAVKWRGSAPELPKTFGSRSMAEDSNNYYVRIKMIDRTDVNSMVYNLSTENQEYSVPFVVHNCKPPHAKDAYFKYHEFIYKTFNAVTKGEHFAPDEGNLRPIIDFSEGLPLSFKPSGSFTHYIHVDLGLKQDRAGFAMCHKDGDTIFPDFLHAFEAPPSGEIDFGTIRELVSILSQRGFSIVGVTFDGWQSVDSIQLLKKMGFMASTMPITKEVYDTLKDIMYAGKMEGYFHPLIIQELLDLELINGRKVDHKSGGTKDLADALAGATYNCLKGDSGLPSVHVFSTEGKEEDGEGREQVDEEESDKAFLWNVLFQHLTEDEREEFKERMGIL